MTLAPVPRAAHMNRDKKLGLALGVLLLGIVAAFFFRNEPNGGPEPPLLVNPKPLNDRIAERPVTPYLNGLDPAERPRARIPRHVGDGPTTREKSDWAIRPDDSWGRAPTNLPEIARNDAPGHGTLPPPQPIPVASESPGKPAVPRAPEHNREWSTAASPPKGTSDEEILHDVKSGETLSGLAVKYLGSPTRYEEIMKVNRDQLRTPRDLRAGMKIRIPKRMTAERPAVRDRAAETATRVPGAPDPKRTAVDRPVRKSPPTRNVTSGGVEELDEPFEAGPTKPARITRPVDRIESDPQAREIEIEESGTTPSDVGSSRSFRPARRNPFLPGQEEIEAKPPVESGSSRSLRQRPPENLPSAKADDLPRPSPSAFEEVPFPEDRAASAASSNPPEPKPFDSKNTLSSRPPASSLPSGSSGSIFPDEKPSKGTAAFPRVPADRLAPGRYLVQRGDTLERIARRLLGDPNAAARILEANRDVLQDPDELREGMSLRIPM